MLASCVAAGVKNSNALADTSSTSDTREIPMTTVLPIPGVMSQDGADLLAEQAGVVISGSKGCLGGSSRYPDTRKARTRCRADCDESTKTRRETNRTRA